LIDSPSIRMATLLETCSGSLFMQVSSSWQRDSMAGTRD
jgi:hypothetical protein